MTAKERFAEDWKMPLAEVGQLVKLARDAGKCNEAFSNGDWHSSNANPADKNRNAQLWGAEVDAHTVRILALVKPYGFTAVEYTGLGPTLKRGEQFVEIPYLGARP
jgi:hypothetical protein